MASSIHAGRAPGTTTIEGRTVNTHQEYALSFQTGGYGFAFLADDGLWKKVRKVEHQEPCETWNLRVEDDESYTAEGCIVKNCPLQLDIVERLINRYSNPGEVVYDPFAGISTVPYVAIHEGRQGWGTELAEEYWRCGVGYCEQAEAEATMPTLFDVGLTEAVAS